MIKNIFNNKKGRVQKLILIIFLVLLIFLIPIGIYAFENTANVDDNSVFEQPFEEIVDDVVENQPIEEEISNGVIEDVLEEDIVEEQIVDGVEKIIEEEIIEDIVKEEVIDEEVIDLCENLNCEDSETECPDDFVSSCSNICDLETGECSVCEPICDNLFLIENSTEDESEIFNESNSTLISDLESGLNNSETEPGSEPEINVQIFSPEKITRGEVIEIKSTITNSGAVIKDVLATWDLPFGFEIISGDKITNCGNLDNGETCELSISIESSISTSLGNNEIKIKGNYKNGI